MNHFMRYLTLTILITLAACGPAVSTDTLPTNQPVTSKPTITIATLEPHLTTCAIQYPSPAGHPCSIGHHPAISHPAHRD